MQCLNDDVKLGAWVQCPNDDVKLGPGYNVQIMMLSEGLGAMSE